METLQVHSNRRLLPRIEWLYTFDNFGVFDEIIEELLPAFGRLAGTF